MQLLKDDASPLRVLNMTDVGNKRIINCRKSLLCPQTNMRDRPEPQRGAPVDPDYASLSIVILAYDQILVFEYLNYKFINISTLDHPMSHRLPRKAKDSQASGPSICR